jgi:hypothetical protein
MAVRNQILAQQRLYLSYLPHVRAQFGSLPGIQMIGLGAKERGGQLTEEWAFRFYVNEKKEKENIPAGEYIPERIFGVKTDVISHFEQEPLVCEADVLSIDDTDYRDDGVQGGIPVRNEYFDNGCFKSKDPSGYGTLGILARRKADNALVGLTCAHVVNAGSQDLSAINVRIGQPDYWTCCCCCPRGYIGDVSKCTFNADLDCALIVMHDDVTEKVNDKNTERKIVGMAAEITGAAAMVCFDTVTKRGRATGITTGKVSDIAYGTNQMLIERTGDGADGPFACHGDSGAVVVNSSNQVVGLIVASARANMKRTIVTHIKPVMQDLGITIAGTDAASIGEPLGGGPSGCELLIWPGGHADTALNPAETFSSSDFGFTGAVNWDVSKGGAGAVIVETGTQTASALESVSVRYDTTSPTKNPTDTVQVQAVSGGETRTKFRTVFTFTPRAVNTSNPLDADNTKQFDIKGGTTNLAEVHTPAGASDWFMAKAEIIFDITPQGIAWSGGGAISFVTNAPPGLKGNITARRQTKFTKGEQQNGTPNRIHTDQITFIDAGPCTAADFQEPTDAKPNALYRLASEGFDPSNLLQGYLRADYNDYLEFHDGTAWVRITPEAGWFANLTGSLNAAPPPGAGAPNNSGAGANAEKVPNQTPVINPAGEMYAAPGDTNVRLSVSGTDPDNDVTGNFRWVQTSGTPVALSGGGVGNPVTFTAPAGNGDLGFTVTCTDGTDILSRAPGNHQSAPVNVTVHIVEWAAWPGGQADTALNPTEALNAADMGFAAGTLLNWHVGHGGVNPVIVGGAGVTANGVANITLRYDTQSPNPNIGGVVRIEATDPGSGVTNVKLRTVFTVTPQAANTSNNLHGLGTAGGAAGRDDLRYRASHGTTTQAGVVNPTMAGVTSIAAKMEQVYTIEPKTIPWSRRLTQFVFDDAGAAVPSVPQMVNTKFECRARRDRQAVIMVEALAGPNRDFAVITQGGARANDAAMVNDGFADSGDCQYPTDAAPNHMFRIDSPAVDPAASVNQYTLRSNFREYVAWHNGTPGAAGWSRITPYSLWFANLTMAFPTVAKPHPNMVAPNNSGTGAGAVNINNVSPVINAGADRVVSDGDNVSINATFTDSDHDLMNGTLRWTQTAGTVVIPGGTFNGNPLVFTAPGTPGVLTFTVQADDNTVNANSYNPGNSRGVDTINVTVN